jgi:hypothetical protein
VKVREPVGALADALTATLAAELVALVALQLSALVSDSAAARTAANVVLTVR